MMHAESLLLEASAGTGKTYSIERKVLGLVARKKNPLSLRQVLLVTFTEAATLELGERIRALLVKVIKDDEQSKATLAEVGLMSADPLEHQAMLNRLKAQLQDFSNTSIFTIHGFCTLILSRYSMELGLPSKQVVDNRYRYQAFKDFFRERLANKYSWQLGEMTFEAEARQLASQSVIACFGNAQNHPDADDFADILARLNAQGIFDTSLYAYDWDCLEELWNDAFLPYAACLLGYNNGDLACESEEIELFFNKFHSKTRYLDNLELNEQFAGKRKIKFTKSASKALLSFATKCSAFVLAKAINDSFEDWLKGRRDLAGSFSFDDLVKELASLLETDHGQKLLSTMRHDYKAVLIDEFQDTDPGQWSIFSKFLKHSTLIAVGDPKQAIYAFRGADIGTYFNSRTSFDSSGSLETNYRSNPSMLEQLNRLSSRWFGLALSRYDSANLTYEPLVPGLAKKQPPVLRDASGTALPSFGVLPLSHDASMKAYSRDDKVDVLRQRAYKHCTSSIIGLLANAYLGSDPQMQRKLEADDIAILVESFKDAYRIRDNLHTAGIAASIQGRGDLRSCQEADEMLLFCRAVQNPSDPSSVRAFLLSRLGGLGYKDLLSFVQSPSYTSFASQLEVWNKELSKSGFLAIFAQLERGQHLSAYYQDSLEADLWLRLFSLNGDKALRSFANYQHLAELLDDHCQKEAAEGGRLAWVFLDMLETMGLGEQSPLRRERQTGSVRIMTQHSSKGLEFEVVYAMIGLSTNREKGAWNTWEDNKNGQTVRSLAPKLGHVDPLIQTRIAQAKALEKLRLYYVAISRAKCGLILPYLSDALDDNKASPLWLHEWCKAEEGQHQEQALLYQDPALFTSKDDLGAFSLESYKQLSKNETANSSQTKSSPRQSVVQLNAQLLPACTLSDADLVAEELCSFTSLHKRQMGLSHESSEPSLKDRDALLPKIEPAKSDPAALPRGAVFGTLFHEIVAKLDMDQFLHAWQEELSFAQLEPSMLEVFERQLSASGLAKHPALLILKHKNIRSHALCQLLHAGLSAASLGLIQAKKRIYELEFMARIAETKQPALLDHIELREGFLTGSIDLVYQTADGAWNIIDWKTNSLSTSAEDLKSECLTIMEEAKYTLQALIYQSVLKLLLQAEGKEANLGSVYYVFVRGSQITAESQSWVVDLGSQVKDKVDDFIAQTGLSLRGAEL